MQKIYSIISSTLADAFPDAEIYKENEGSMDTPAFTILQINNSQLKKVGNRYKREYNFQIVHVPDFNITTDYVRLSEVAEKLYEALEYMEYEGEKLRGLDMKFRIEDNTLSFFITIKTQHYRKIEDNKMENLEIERG